MPTKPEATTRSRISEMLEKGLTVREIATLLGITTQAVYLHIKAMRLEEAAS